MISFCAGDSVMKEFNFSHVDIRLESVDGTDGRVSKQPAAQQRQQTHKYIRINRIHTYSLTSVIVQKRRSHYLARCRPVV